MGYLIASYALVFGTTLLYRLHLARERSALQRSLSLSPRG